MKDFCFRCGECCNGTYFNNIVISEDEKNYLEELLGRPLEIDRTFDRNIDDGKTAKRYVWRTKPCPFVVNHKCSIYDKRPCQCRLYHCGRLNRDEKISKTTNKIIEAMTKNPEYGEYKRYIEMEGIEWGNAHGWYWKKSKPKEIEVEVSEMEITNGN